MRHLEGWTYILTYGSLKVYGYKLLRIALDENGEQILGYLGNRYIQ